MIILSFFTGRVAQLVERQSNKLPVEGSSPFMTIQIVLFTQHMTQLHSGLLHKKFWTIITVEWMNAKPFVSRRGSFKPESIQVWRQMAIKKDLNMGVSFDAL